MRKGERTVRHRLGSVQVKAQDGNGQLCFQSAADIFVHNEAEITFLVITLSHGHGRYVTGIVVDHLI